MSQFRLHVDVPLGTNEEEATAKSRKILSLLTTDALLREELAGYIVNYRLGHDDDRQKSNYLDKNDNGHVSTKKCKIEF